MTPTPISASDPVTNLAEAMVVNSSTPLIMLDENLTIIAASLSFCDVFGLAPAEGADYAQGVEVGGHGMSPLSGVT